MRNLFFHTEANSQPKLKIELVSARKLSV